MIFRAVDLETNGVVVKSTEVAQVAIVSARSEQCAVPRSCPMTIDADVQQQPDSVLPTTVDVPGMRTLKTSNTLCRVSSMPAGATKVHGLTVEGLKNEPLFMSKVKGLVGALTKPGVVVVTFNGARFDLPIIARYAAAHGKLQKLVGKIDGAEAASARTRLAATQDRFEELLNRRHIDVARVWQVARARERMPPWQSELRCRAARANQLVSEMHYEGAPVSDLHAGMFAGSLAAAHGFWCGRSFDGAHEASADCVATLAVLRAMMTSGLVGVETAIRWSREPLPGDVDFDGVFKWDGDQAVCKLKKFQDVPIEKIERGFLTWMLDPERDFHRHTKHVVREWLAGRYPVREYEKESEIP